MRELIVWSVLWYLRAIAKLSLFINKPYVIGIAGSAGKSSAKLALYAVIKDYHPTKALFGNSETGIPLSILGIDISGYSARDWAKALAKCWLGIFYIRKYKYLIIEMGIDDPNPPKNMSYLLSVVKPDMAISLNVSGPHLMQFEKVLKNASENITSSPDKRYEYILKCMAEEDTKIITKSNCKVGIYNSDNQYVREAVKSKNLPNTKLLSFGMRKENSVSYGRYDINLKRTKFSYIIGGKDLEIYVKGFILPEVYKETFASIILSCHELGLTITQIKTSLENNFKLPEGRATILNGIKNSIIIDSTYNAPKPAVLSFLNMLHELGQKTGRPTIAVIGDMRELGNESEREHKEVAERLLKTASEVYCVGPLTSEFIIPIIKKNIGNKEVKTERVEWYKNSAQLALHLKETLPKNSIILVKGSQNEIFLEEAIKFLLENSNDAKLLTRQEDYWMKAKQSFFTVS